MLPITIEWDLDGKTLPISYTKDSKVVNADPKAIVVIMGLFNTRLWPGLSWTQLISIEFSNVLCIRQKLNHKVIDMIEINVISEKFPTFFWILVNKVGNWILKGKAQFHSL